MSFLIPVTLASTTDIKSSKTIKSHPNQTARNRNLSHQSPTQTNPQLPNQPQLQISPSLSPNHNLPKPFREINSHHPPTQIKPKYQNIHPSISCPSSGPGKTCQDQLQKKSTRSSLQADFCHISTSEQHQNSIANINSQSEPPNEQNYTNLEQNLETESDVLPQLIYSCKICLQANNEPTYDPATNPIVKVCNCIDYVHMKCLEQWITRRDILNQQIGPDQCEVCLAFYQIDLRLEPFFCVETFCKNFKADPKGVCCELVPSLVFFSLLMLGIYVLGSLIYERESEGGKMRALLSMPYGTCITVAIFLILILMLIFGIFFYSWIREFWMDFKFKVKPVRRKKNNLNRLKKIFSRIR